MTFDQRPLLLGCLVESDACNNFFAVISSMLLRKTPYCVKLSPQADLNAAEGRREGNMGVGMNGDRDGS